MAPPAICKQKIWSYLHLLQIGPPSSTSSIVDKDKDKDKFLRTGQCSVFSFSFLGEKSSTIYTVLAFSCYPNFECHCDQTSSASLSLAGVLSQQLQQLQLLLQVQQLLATQLSRFSPLLLLNRPPRQQIAQICTLSQTRFWPESGKSIFCNAPVFAGLLQSDNHFCSKSCCSSFLFCREPVCNLGKRAGAISRGDMGNTKHQLQLKAAAVEGSCS